MMKHTLLLLTTALTLAACGSVGEWATVGGSRADGTVTLAYERGEFEGERTDNHTAHQKALKRCKLWGYTNAEAFDAIERKCIVQQGVFSSCSRWQHTLQYQCTNHKSDMPAKTHETDLRPVN